MDEIKTDTAQSTDGVSQLNIIEKPKVNKTKVFKIVFYTVFFLFCGGALAYTGYQDLSKEKLLSFADIFILIGRNWYYLLLAVFSMFCVYLAKAMKKAFMLKNITGKFRFGLGFKTAMVGVFYDNITPLGSGGQPFEVYYMAKHGVDAGKATAVPITSLFFRQITFVGLTLAALIVSPLSTLPATYSLAIIGVIFAFVIPLLIMLFSLMPKTTSRIVAFFIAFLSKLKIVKNREVALKKSIRLIKNNANTIKMMSKKPITLFALIIFGIAEHVANASIVYFTLRTFGYDIPNLGGIYEWFEIFWISMTLYSAISFVPTPGNAGMSELTFHAVFTGRLLGGAGFTAMLTWRILSYYLFIAIGAIFLSVGTITHATMKQEATTLKRHGDDEEPTDDNAELTGNSPPQQE